MFERFNDRARSVIVLAQEEARSLHSKHIGTEHILLGLLHGGVAAISLEISGISLEDVRNQLMVRQGEQLAPDPGDVVTAEVADHAPSPPPHIPFTPRAKKVLELSLREALQLGHNYIGTEHLLLGLIREGDGTAAQVLAELGVQLNRVRQHVIQVLATHPVDGLSKDLHQNPIEKENPPTSAVLDKLGRNLTQAAMEGKLDPVIGREKEIARVMQVLSQRAKNNPVLIGEPGVRKTSVVEGLAQAIVRSEVPRTLERRLLYEIDYEALMAGTSNDLKERLQEVLEEVRARGDTILFVDGLHALFGDGIAAEVVDAAADLKLALLRGELQTIGAATPEEYRKNIETDSSLERLFQSVKVGEPSVGDTVEMLKTIRAGYETYHRVSITDDAIEAAVVLSDRYIDDRYLPEKAIDLIDEAGARMKMLLLMAPPDLRELDNKIAETRRLKESAIDVQEFSEAASLREKEKQLVAHRAEREKQWRYGDLDVVAEVDAEQVAAVVADMTYIDAQDLLAILPWAVQHQPLPAVQSGVEVCDSSTDNRYLMLNDKPVENDAGDVLGTANIAQRIASIILESKDAAPFVMAVDGGWGVGKSTLLSQIEAQLPGKPEVVKVRFNAWTAAGDNALESLIKSVLLELDPNVVRRWARKLVKRRGMIGIARVGFAIVAKFFGVTRLVDDMWSRLEVDAQARNQLRDSIQGMLSEWVNGSVEGSGRRALVVFVDDLDRCTDEVVVRVCEAVKLYLDAPGLIFLVACDLSVLARGVAGPARGGVGEGRTYLEKIIQVAYRVPAPSKAAVRRLVESYGRRSGITHLLDSTVIDILSEATGRNPRRIKRIINSFVLENHLDPAWRRHPLSSALLITAILLQQLYASFYMVLIDENAGDDPIGDFLDYATLRARAWNPPSGDDAWWSVVSRTFRKQGLPAPRAAALAVGESLPIDELEKVFPPEYPALARNEAFVALLKGIGGPHLRLALRAHLLSSPLGTDIAAAFSENEPQPNTSSYVVSEAEAVSIKDESPTA